VPRSLLTLIACVPLLGTAAPASAQPLETGVFDHIEFAAADRDIAFNHVRAAGGTTVRIPVPWSTIAPGPGEETRPAGFDPRDPLDPMYDFSVLDQEVVSATQHGLEPLLTLFYAPQWAQRGDEGLYGSQDPDPKEFGYFAEAVAKRYSGDVLGLPKVTRWQGWTEPNLYRYLVPQYDAPLANPPPDDAKPVSPGLYRNLLVQFERAVHGVSEDNVVISAGLAPFRLAYPNVHAVAPLRFLRELLCMTDENKPKGNCGPPLHFDAISTHPYTEGGPNHEAAESENVSMGDLPEFRALVDAAVRAGRIVSKGKLRFWITEFSWDTNPPDDKAISVKLHSRWVAEALYRMWQNGVSLITWFKIRDEPVAGADGMHYECGLYFFCEQGIRCDRPKRSLQAFRFPFVAFKSGRRVRVWGRTPAGEPARVKVEQRRGGRWRPLGRIRTDRAGIFRARLRRKGKGPVRARTRLERKERSLPFELGPTKDVVVPIFG
jgi:hypothetical protein